MKQQSISWKKGIVALLALGSLATPLQAQRVFINGVPDPKKDASIKEKVSTVDMRISSQVRVIPTWEKNFDFGMMDNYYDNPNRNTTTLGLLFASRSSDNDPRIHSTEAGRVSNEFIRTEAKLNFEFTPTDGLWNLFMSLECDTVLDMDEADNRCRNFGLERLNGMLNLKGIYSELHAGWDLYAIDATYKNDTTLSIGGALSIYGDDDPGIWLQGQHPMGFGWQFGWHKKVESNATSNGQTRSSTINPFSRHPDAENYDPDRNIYDIVLSYEIPRTKNIFKLIWVRDVIHTPSDTSIQAEYKAASPATDPKSVAAENAQSAKVVSTYQGFLYYGTFFNDILRVTGEYVTQGGKANNTGICNAEDVLPGGECRKNGDDYNIDANLTYINVNSGVWGNAQTGIGGRLGISYLKTSGDDKDDDQLNGYTGVIAGQRFSQDIGGEHSIAGEQNVFGKGNQLYGFIPEYFGSRGRLAQSGVTIGGLRAGVVGQEKTSQGGRGDNPGLTLINWRMENRFSEHWVLRLQYRDFQYNEPFYPFLTNGIGGKPINDKKVGDEFDIEVYYLFNWNAIITLAYSQFNPGTAIEKVAEAYTGERTVASAKRTAAELIWRF